MIEQWAKIWIVETNSIFETPRVCTGFVSDVLSSSEYVITHDDGTEKLYQVDDIFLSCRDANQRQMDVLAKRLNFLRPKLNKMENTLISMMA